MMSDIILFSKSESMSSSDPETPMMSLCSESSMRLSKTCSPPNKRVSV